MASLRQGRGLKPSARAAGVGKETGQRWLREAFIALRDQGWSVAEAQVSLGFTSSRMIDWDAARAARGDGRHHLRRDAEVEAVFWSVFEAKGGIDVAGRGAGVGRSTAYRWWRQRFIAMREDGVAATVVARRLRVPAAQATAWEAGRRQAREVAERAQQAAQRAAVRSAGAYADALMTRRARPRVQAREERYWQLMRQGMSNTQACKILGVHRKTGQLIRRRHDHQTAAAARRNGGAGATCACGNGW